MKPRCSCLPCCFTRWGGVTPILWSVRCEHAREAMTRIQMPVDAQRTVEFLIRHQSDLSDAASRPDADDSVTARLLAERVGTIERLKLLSVMTYAKIAGRSTRGKGRPRDWKHLWRICSITEHELTCELETDRIEKIPEDLPANAEFIKGFPLRYLRAHSPAEIAGHLQLFELSRPTGVAVRLEPMEGRLPAHCGGTRQAVPVCIVRRSDFQFRAGYYKSRGLLERIGSASGYVRFRRSETRPPANPGETDRLIDLIQRLALGKADGHRLMKGTGSADAARKKAAVPLGAVRFGSLPASHPGRGPNARPARTAV